MKLCLGTLKYSLWCVFPLKASLLIERACWTCWCVQSTKNGPRSADPKSILRWVPLVDCIVILHNRYRIAVTIDPIACHQCCLGRAAAAQVLTLGEEIEDCAEHQYSDKVKSYKSSIKPSVFNTTRQNLLSPEGVNFHTTSSQYTPVYYQPLAF